MTGYWCHVSENTKYLISDLMEDSVPANLLFPQVPAPDWASTFACAKNGSKPRERVPRYHRKRDSNRAFALVRATRPNLVLA